MRLIRWLGLMAIVGAAPPALADILVWRDSVGISHYTNDLANVPPEYRGDAMTVARDWARTASPRDPAPAGVPAFAAGGVTDFGAAMPVAATQDERAVRESYDASYAARRRAASEGDVAEAVTNLGTVAQNVQREPSAPTAVDRLVPVPVVPERGGRRRPPPETDMLDQRTSFPPATRPAFSQGAGGPPPITER
jgi:hypothetical protein